MGTPLHKEEGAVSLLLSCSNSALDFDPSGEERQENYLTHFARGNIIVTAVE
jgi:hypothetical protein